MNCSYHTWLAGLDIARSVCIRCSLTSRLSSCLMYRDWHKRVSMDVSIPLVCSNKLEAISALQGRNAANLVFRFAC